MASQMPNNFNNYFQIIYPYQISQRTNNLIHKIKKLTKYKKLNNKTFNNYNKMLKQIIKENKKIKKMRQIKNKEIIKMMSFILSTVELHHMYRNILLLQVKIQIIKTNIKIKENFQRRKINNQKNKTVMNNNQIRK